MPLKEGDQARISLIGGDYRVKWIGDSVVVLETEDGSGQFLTAVDKLDFSIESTSSMGGINSGFVIETGLSTEKSAGDMSGEVNECCAGSMN
jgi:hypothetical protein